MITALLEFRLVLFRSARFRTVSNTFVGENDSIDNGAFASASDAYEAGVNGRFASSNICWRVCSYDAMASSRRAKVEHPHVIVIEKRRHRQTTQRRDSFIRNTKALECFDERFMRIALTRQDIASRKEKTGRKASAKSSVHFHGSDNLAWRNSIRRVA